MSGNNVYPEREIASLLAEIYPDDPAAAALWLLSPHKLLKFREPFRELAFNGSEGRKNVLALLHQVVDGAYV